MVRGFRLTEASNNLMNDADQRLGPLLVGLAGTELNEAERQYLGHPAVGGVVLFTRNYDSRAQLETLVGTLHEAAGRRLLVCVDHEGGRVQRFREGFTRLPPLRDIGDLWADSHDRAIDMAYRHARVMATELLQSGVDLSFAPVLDIDGPSEVIGDRAFSRDPEVIVTLGRSYLAGMHDAGMRTTGKHFPGHGSVAPDSHVADVLDARRLGQLARADLVPFRDLAGDLDALMMAHVTYPAIDEQPAGYSDLWIKGVLRSQWGWRGTVFSDDLGMHAARTAGDMLERMRQSLAAGCDAALVCSADDSADLLARIDGAPSDATAALQRLFGRPAASREEVDSVPEWRQWQASLAEMSTGAAPV